MRAFARTCERPQQALRGSANCRKAQTRRGPCGASGSRGQGPENDEERSNLRTLEDELRDPKYFLEYFLPRPLRLTLFGGAAVSCLIATLLAATRFAANANLAAADGTTTNLGVNVTGFTVFLALFLWDRRQAETRIVQRAELRQRQIAFGDREVYVNPEGERMSRLKEVDDEWIVRRLERWGEKDGMPFIGPDKADIIQGIVRDAAPRVVVEVGGMCGYSGLKLAQALPQGGRVLSIERDWKWVLAAKRFLWQAGGGPRNAALREAGLEPVGRRVTVLWGDARQVLSTMELPVAAEGGGGAPSIDLLLLDGTPKETLEYLRAAEPRLADGATVIADNAGVFKDGGMKAYLEYVRTDARYRSSFIESHFEWRPDVPDGLEVSVFHRGRAPAAGAAADEAAAVS